MGCDTVVTEQNSPNYCEETLQVEHLIPCSILQIEQITTALLSQGFTSLR